MDIDQYEMSNDEHTEQTTTEIWMELRDDAGRLWARLELTQWRLELRRAERSATFDLRVYLLRW